jgi:hypothetical protein
MFAVLFFLLGVLAPYTTGQTTTSAARSTSATTGTARTSSSSPPDRSEGLRVCFSDDSICAAGQDLRVQCDQEQEAHGSDGYYQCVCGSGYAAVDEA